MLVTRDVQMWYILNTYTVQGYTITETKNTENEDFQGVQIPFLHLPHSEEDME